MPNSPPKHSSENGHEGRGGAGWVLGVLGLVWISGIAVRLLRRGAVRLAEADHAMSGTRRPKVELSRPGAGYETRDANVKWIFGIVLFLLICGLVIHGILAGFLSSLKREAPPRDAWQPVAASGAQQPPPRPAFPALQVSPPLDLQAFRLREDTELNSYGWVNRTSGIVRIPLDRAMDVVLHEGLPTRKNAGQNRTGPSSYDLMQQRPEHRQPEIEGEK